MILTMFGHRKKKNEAQIMGARTLSETHTHRNTNQNQPRPPARDTAFVLPGQPEAGC